ncbi:MULTISPECIES: FliA/WhiG family RNA polymerase sigma factor [Allobacillus]|uniref:FliA/WhiG family RNA polymerase sigma factor n=1 Tax=Allobacillus halotolerans TaxID=570278 RepID=A0ABS6GPL1_9BACI|nr:MULTISPECIES: FliA/WhiG family RNA polymerase sigma factor [Allobacillus]MBU6081060.1 FliA/WhiG family RNA polymerase sigma factor [Allobacillus halotolerans]TSJ69203.1 FliA/WhiG family RNA polymerase sigma factor [Allobacillus sp. SKP2-8]
MVLTEDSLKTIWKKWQQDKDEQAGNKLVEHYMPLVDYQVNRIYTTLPKNVERQDIKSLAFMGLVDALEKFDPNRDLKFDTYASFRIKGSIIDGLRKEDWLPRSVREKAKIVEQATERLEKRLNREPKISEIANEVGISHQETSEIVKDTLVANFLSIEEQKSEQQPEHRESLRNTIPDRQAYTPEESSLKKEQINELVTVITELNEKEQLVLQLFYKEELTFTEIGGILQLSTSRISQIHTKSIAKLKSLLTTVQ